MKKCPACGNTYRADVDVCPNDGTRLSSGPPSNAPPRRPPPASDPPKKPRQAKRPAPRPVANLDEPGGLTEKSSAGSWIFALLACLLMFGGFYWARGQLLGPSSEEQAVEDEAGDSDEARKRKRRKPRRRKKRGARADDERSYEDYDWTQDFEVDDRTFGDVINEREPEPEYVEVREPEPYDPSPDEYQPDGRYRPVARYAEPGAGGDVVEIDLSGGGAGPLKPAQVEPVLDERTLMACYDRWVNKVPQMKGRVWMDFVVAPDGHVSKVVITRSQLRSRVVEKCLVQRARRFRFPASDGRSTKFDTHFDFTNR